MKTVIRPASPRSLPIWLLAGAVACAAVVGVGVSVVRVGLSPSSLGNAAGVLIITAFVIAVLLIEDKRARSVEVNEAGLVSLAWSRTTVFPFVVLKRVETLWTSVESFGMRGFVLALVSRERTVNVNTYLFPDPKGVNEFIGQCLAQRSSRGEAL
jgi:hypothetical protein